MRTTPNTKPAAKMTRKELVDYLKAADAYEGHSRDSADDLRDIVANLQADAEAEATEPAEPEAHPDPKERVRLAAAEHKALQAWSKDGENPPRPATPNLDAVNAEYAAGVTAKERKRAAKATTSTRTRANRVELGTLPEGAAEGTCRTCEQVLPATKFPKAVVNGQRQANVRADECRSCRQVRRAG